MNPNDRIRDIVLRYFYDRNAAATSEVGDKSGVACSLDTLQHEISERHSLSREQVTSNLTYLVDRGWITPIERRAVEPVQAWKQTYPGAYGATTTFDQGNREKVLLYYKISARGIDKIEGDSAYKLKEKMEGINITADRSIVITGDGNVVDAKHVDLKYELDRLREALTSSDISEREKLNVAMDIDSLQSQLAKAAPNKTVVSSLWRAIEEATKVAGLIEAISKVQPFITSLLSRLAG